MLSSMQISRLCSFLPLLLLLTLRISPSNGFNSTAVKADVGVILDLHTTVGKIFKTCISMAVEDFYSKNSYNTMIVPHFVDSRSDVVDAASAAIDFKLRVGVPMKWRTSELVSVTRDEETNEVNATGFCIDVFKDAMKLLPYHVEYEFVPFENAEPNSTGGYHYDSLIEQLLLKNFDAVVADVTISAKRTLMADFSISYIDSGISTVVPIEEKSKENAWNFMKPLTKGLWFTIAGFLILTGFVVWALKHGVNEEFSGQPHKQIGMIFWFAFSTLVFAHKEKVKRNLSRFVVIIWLFVVLVLTSSYTANLTSMLTERDRAFMFELNVAPRNKHKPCSIWPLPMF